LINPLDGEFFDLNDVESIEPIEPAAGGDA
jgi:hypothetical protein